MKPTDPPADPEPPTLPRTLTLHELRRLAIAARVKARRERGAQ